MYDASLEHLTESELGPVPLQFRQKHALSLLSSGDWSREQVARLYGVDALPPDETLSEITEDNSDLEEIE